jgi:hypothetical protein
MNNVEAYPLTWPVGYPRTKYPERNLRFKQTSLAKCRDLVLKELERLGARGIVLSTNIPLRQDGLPYGDFERRHITDKGVAVYFSIDKQPTVLCCDAWDRWEDNFYSIAKTIEAMRGIDRWGVSEMLKRAFTGFTALPESTTTTMNVWQILGLSDCPADVDSVKAAYRQQVKKVHPDVPGGSHELMQKLNLAYEEALNLFR